MFIYIKGPLANRFAAECFTEKPEEGPKADVNEEKITDTSQTPLCGSRGCVGVKAVKIH